MIHDNIRNIENYKNDSKLYAALVALKQFVAGKKYDENSITSFSKVECSTRLREDAQLENHHKYIDIHYVIAGTERILISNRNDLERLSGYSEGNDCELFTIPNDAESVELKEGDFLVVYPGENHAPKIAVNNEVTMICKVVVKL